MKGKRTAMAEADIEVEEVEALRAWAWLRAEGHWIRHHNGHDVHARLEGDVIMHSCANCDVEFMTQLPRGWSEGPPSVAVTLRHDAQQTTDESPRYKFMGKDLPDF
jgi:hypothetical protein